MTLLVMKFLTTVLVVTQLQNETNLIVIKNFLVDFSWWKNFARLASKNRLSHCPRVNVCNFFSSSHFVLYSIFLTILHYTNTAKFTTPFNLFSFDRLLKEELYMDIWMLHTASDSWNGRKENTKIWFISTDYKRRNSRYQWNRSILDVVG